MLTLCTLQHLVRHCGIINGCLRLADRRRRLDCDIEADRHTGGNAAQNAAILAVELLALSDETIAQRLAIYKCNLKAKIEKANKDLAEVKYQFKTN